MDKNISIYELGKLAQNGDEVAMLEIINRKKKFIKGFLMVMKIDTNT